MKQLVDKVAVVVEEEETQRLLELLVQHQLDQISSLVNLELEQRLEVVIDMVVTVLNLLVVAVVALVVVQMVKKMLEVETVVLVS